MVKDKSTGEKLATLREHHALNPRPEAVIDPAFISEGGIHFPLVYVCYSSDP